MNNYMTSFSISCTTGLAYSNGVVIGIS